MWSSSLSLSGGGGSWGMSTGRWVESKEEFVHYYIKVDHKGGGNHPHPLPPCGYLGPHHTVQILDQIFEYNFSYSYMTGSKRSGTVVVIVTAVAVRDQFALAGALQDGHKFPTSSSVRSMQTRSPPSSLVSTSSFFVRNHPLVPWWSFEQPISRPATRYQAFCHSLHSCLCRLTQG